MSARPSSRSLLSPGSLFLPAATVPSPAGRLDVSSRPPPAYPSVHGALSAANTVYRRQRTARDSVSRRRPMPRREFTVHTHTSPFSRCTTNRSQQHPRASSVNEAQTAGVTYPGDLVEERAPIIPVSIGVDRSSSINALDLRGCNSRDLSITRPFANRRVSLEIPSVHGSESEWVSGNQLLLGRR